MPTIGIQLEDINDEFANADVALVIGANDVAVPGGAHERLIFGMPILNADKAKHVYVAQARPGQRLRRHRQHAVSTPDRSTRYGDAQAVLVGMIEAVRGLGTAAAA